MASVATPDEGPYNLRSDGGPGIDGFLGDFHRGPAIFSLYDLGPLHPAAASVRTYLVDAEDGAGPRECCRFTNDPDDSPEWAPAWNGDPWCAWILDQCPALMGEPGSAQASAEAAA